jgi:hypothetical protein
MKEHLRLAGAIAATGFVFTSKPWLRFLDRLSPEVGLILKNIIIFLVIFGLHYVDGLIGPPHRQALGFLLMYSAFNIIFNYQSHWITDVGAENVEHQTPDGALYERARSLFSPDISRLVVFVLIPFIFILTGSTLIPKRVKLD